MPIFQKGAQGRDHNPDGFTCWLAGAGVKRGVSHGVTDELGRKAVENIHPSTTSTPPSSTSSASTTKSSPSSTTVST